MDKEEIFNINGDEEEEEIDIVCGENLIKKKKKLKLTSSILRL
jgi:hypothetical protein